MRARSTYRSERRNEWRGMNQWLEGRSAIEWGLFNARKPGADPWHIGSIEKPRRVPRGPDQGNLL